MNKAKVAIVLASAVAAGAALMVLAAPRPASLPPGAAPLTILTQAPAFWPPAGLGCPAVQVADLRIERTNGRLSYFVQEDGLQVEVVWPAGFSARLLNERAELVGPDGRVFASEGDVIRSLEGSAGPNGEVIICISFASRPFIVPRAP